MIKLRRAFVSRILTAAPLLPHLLVLVSVLIVAGTGGAFAQFTIESGRNEGMREGGRGTGTDIGIGIGIGVGKAIIDKAAEDDARKKSGAGGNGQTMTRETKQPKRAARKGDDTPVPVKPPKQPAPQPTISELPVETVTGGKLHRGTGTYEGRPSINCWVEKTDKTCKDYKEYQFVEVDVTMKWGDGAEENVNAAVNKAHPGGIRAKGNSAITRPGSWGADEYADATGNRKTVKDPNTKEERKGGPYKPFDIPGKGTKGLVDAPSWQVTGGGLFVDVAPKDVQKLPGPQKSPKKPDDIKLGTIKVTQHFLSYVFCDDDCLGYFGWDYVETLTFTLGWTEATASVSAALDPSSGPVGGKKKSANELEQEEKDRIKNWVPTLISPPSSTIVGPTIGKWQPCP
jgi:hypothetical protein